MNNQKSLSEKICLWTIKIGALGAIISPLVVSDKFFFPFVGPKSLWFMAFSQIVFFAYLFLALSSPKYRPRLNTLLVAFLGFLVVFALSSVLGVDFEESFWSKFERMTGLLMWFHLFGFFLALSSSFKEKKDWLQIFGVSLIASFVICLLYIFEKVIAAQETVPAAMEGLVNLFDKLGLVSGDSNRGGATLGNSSFLGTYLLFNFFISLYLFFQTNKQKFNSQLHKIINFFALLSAGVIGLVLFYSTARAALISTAGGLVLLGMLWLAFANKGKIRKTGVSLLLLSAAGFLAVIFLVFYSPGLVQERLEDRFGISTVRPRIVVYEIAWKGFLEKPFFGWGPENFSIPFVRHFTPKFFTEDFGNDIWYDKAHNIIFDTLAATGIFGFLTYLFLYLASFFVLWRKFFKEKEDFWKAGIFSSVLVAYFVQNLTVFDMIGSYLMFILVLSFVSSDCGKKEEALEMKPKSWFLPLILIIFAFSFANFVVSPAQKAHYAISARLLEPFSLAKLEMYEKTSDTSFVGHDQIIEAFSNSTMEFSYHQDIGYVPEERIKAEFDFVISELEETVENNPLDYRMVLDLGTVYNAYVRFDQSAIFKAEKVLKYAIELSPNNQQGYWYLAQTMLYNNKMEEAITLAEKALELEPEVERSHLILLQILKFNGDQERLSEAKNRALEINPEWATSISSAIG
jgi:putative inorganic carbon (HCO3(-)) transporter